MTFIEIDGSEGEAGGQIIRTAMTLSAITKKPVRIINIRANRPKPGLQMQHLTAVKAVRNVCRGTLEGAEFESKELAFTPGEIVGGKYEFDIGTAGSVVLVAQTIVPILLFASKKSEIRIIGGTHVIRSPGYDYFEKVFLPAIAKFGTKIESEMINPGYYPQGGGEMVVRVEPGKLNGNSSWMQNDETSTIIRLSGLDEGIAIREKKIFVQNNLERVFLRRDKALSVGNALTTWRGYRGAYALGEKGKKAETVAQEALDELNKEKWDVDRHLADQLVIYGALADGRTEYETSQVTEHLKTNIGVVGKFVDRKIELQGNKVIIE